VQYILYVVEISEGNEEIGTLVKISDLAGCIAYNNNNNNNNNILSVTGVRDVYTAPLIVPRCRGAYGDYRQCRGVKHNIQL